MRLNKLSTMQSSLIERMLSPDVTDFSVVLLDTTNSILVYGKFSHFLEYIFQYHLLFLDIKK